jgi:hypothetical protein
MVSQETFEAVIADLKLLQKENRALKKKIKELSEQVQQIELMGLQEQISRLDERTTRLNLDFNDLADKQSLYIQRSLADFIILSTSSFVDYRIPKKSKGLDTQLTASTGAALAKVESSEEPLKDAFDFYNYCLDIASKCGVQIVKYQFP